MSPKATKNGERSAIGFTLFYLAVSTLFAWRIHNWEFVYYVAVISMVGVLFLHIHARIHFSTGVLWTVSVLGLLHMLGGLLPVPGNFPVEQGTEPVLYNLWIIPPYYVKYDQIVHMWGYGVCTWVVWQVFRPAIKETQGRLTEIIIAVLASNGLGAANEIVEFFAVQILPSTNVGGYHNTGWDLVANLTGSLFAALIIAFGTPIEIRIAGEKS